MELFDREDNCMETSRKADYAAIDKLLEKLEAISPNARDNVLHSLLYGYSDYSPANPPLAAIKRFVQKIVAAAEKADSTSEASRRLAEQANSDRLDPDAEQVKTAAFKVVREFDRLCGLLRFKPKNSIAFSDVDEDCGTARRSTNSPGTEECVRTSVRTARRPKNSAAFSGVDDRRYIAYCAPDHFVLPLLADHFWQRFGQQGWAIVDEKRKLVLSGENGKEPALRPLKAKEKIRLDTPRQKQSYDEWEELWKNYHRSINNEERLNPTLQKQFIPCRYWKYLPELE